MNGIVNAIFQTAVTPELLEKAVAAVAKLESDDRKDLTGRAMAIIRMLDEEGLSGHELHLAAAIDFRLEALARLVHRPEMKAWSLPGDMEGMLHVQRIVWEAVAAEPLVEDGDRAAFDPDGFFKRLTALSEAAGHG